MTALTKNSRKGKIIGTGNRSGYCQSLVVTDVLITRERDETSWGSSNFPCLAYGGGSKTVNICQDTQNHRLRYLCVITYK